MSQRQKPHYNVRAPGAPFVPDENSKRKVHTLAAVGVPQDQIALSLGIDAKTLRRHFRETLDQAGVEANAAVAGRLFKMAMEGDVAAAIFWTKARMGWSERVNVHHTSEVTMSLEERLAALEAEPDDQGRPMIEGKITDVDDDGDEARSG